MVPPQFRSINEAIADRLLLLYLLFRTRCKGFSISGTAFERQLKLQKLLYWVEYEMVSTGYKGLNYHFFKWTYGPFAQEIYVDCGHLLINDLITEERRELGVTGKGYEFLENCDEVFEDNPGISAFFDRIIDRFGGYDAEDIKNATYDFPIFGKKTPIGRVRKGELILSKLKYGEAEQVFFIDEKWMPTFQIMFDPVFYSAIKTSLSQMRRERGRPFKPVIRTPSHD